jgi:hypothetical protein
MIFKTRSKLISYFILYALICSTNLNAGPQPRSLSAKCLIGLGAIGAMGAAWMSSMHSSLTPDESATRILEKTEPQTFDTIPPPSAKFMITTAFNGMPFEKLLDKVVKPETQLILFGEQHDPISQLNLLAWTEIMETLKAKYPTFRYVFFEESFDGQPVLDAYMAGRISYAKYKLDTKRLPFPEWFLIKMKALDLAPILTDVSSIEKGETDRKLLEQARNGQADPKFRVSFLKDVSERNKFMADRIKGALPQASNSLSGVLFTGADHLSPTWQFKDSGLNMTVGDHLKHDRYRFVSIRYFWPERYTYFPRDHDTGVKWPKMNLGALTRDSNLVLRRGERFIGSNDFSDISTRDAPISDFDAIVHIYPSNIR